MKSKLKLVKCRAKASSAQNNLANQEAAFYTQLNQNYTSQFDFATSIQQAINQTFAPILAQGVGQYGFTPEENAVLNTQATTGVATNYANAQTALNEQQTSRGGGNVFLPSGAQTQLDAQLAQATAQQQSAEQLQITQAGYQQGLQNFDNAASILGGLGGTANPLGYAGAANSANTSAFNEATTINQENGSVLGTIGGILGGAAGTLLGPAGTAIGSSLGSAVGGILGGGGGGSTAAALNV